MAYIDYVETDFHDYALKWSDDYKIWRNARVLDTYVSGGVFLRMDHIVKEVIWA